MLDLVESTPAAGTRPDPKEAILAASDLFRLHMHCERAACRRAGGCRGSERPGLPRCTLRLVGRCRAVLGAVSTFLPQRPARTEHEPDAQLDRIQKRMADLMERQIEAMEKRADAKARR